MKRTIFLGWDRRERDAFEVAQRSIVGHSLACPDILAIDTGVLRDAGLYRRPEQVSDGLRWDIISQAAMSTEHAISRFLAPKMAVTGWALFMDGDVMARRDIGHLFALADPKYAVQVVKHQSSGIGWDLAGADIGSPVKMDGQVQNRYPCKNWSSVMLFNCDHPANRDLTIDLINTVPGRDLHAFCWLPLDLIGALPSEWNHLVGIDQPRDDAAVVHFTMGTPSMKGYEDQEYADEWRGYL